ncbi:nucleotidyltransferase domain-containing protein [Novosphingobium mathurense]|uniref:Nucleotidyltransferase domain-containing protein n=1 Tax=Novosphingobium mathurense TaxID=428990 RepID=A0A1U6IQM1_9SPHN|nr:nucleotidyltransferase domain-containing protein [Novosphingobium mathurense]SLK10268.1 Nucleotidyltransferase domain-containing protein [Novosphingobium mathurense]
MTRALVISDSERNEVRRVLSAHLPPDFQVHVFGSRAGGSPKPWSDLDLALTGPVPLPLALLAELADAFDESALPFKVDLVDHRTVSEAFSAIIDATAIPFNL